MDFLSLKHQMPHAVSFKETQAAKLAETSLAAPLGILAAPPGIFYPEVDEVALIAEKGSLKGLIGQLLNRRYEESTDLSSESEEASTEVPFSPPPGLSIHSQVRDYAQKISMLDDEEQHDEPANDDDDLQSGQSQQLDDEEEHDVDEPANEVQFEGSWSVGSELHHIGECRPCAWNCRPGGCVQGASCTFCHLCEQGALRQRRKQLERYRKLDRQARRGDSTEQMQGTLSPESGLMDGPSMSVSEGLKAALWHRAVTQVNQEQGYTEETPPPGGRSLGKHFQIIKNPKTGRRKAREKERLKKEEAKEEAEEEAHAEYMAKMMQWQGAQWQATPMAQFQALQTHQAMSLCAARAAHAAAYSRRSQW